jgi:hypothetical protein
MFQGKEMVKKVFSFILTRLVVPILVVTGSKHKKRDLKGYIQLKPARDFGRFCKAEGGCRLI